MPTLEDYAKRPTLRMHEVQDVLGNCSRTTIRRYIDKGLLSEPAKPSERMCLFDTREVFGLLQRKRRAQERARPRTTIITASGQIIHK